MPTVESEIRGVVDQFVERLSALVHRAAVDAAVDALRGTSSKAKVSKGGGIARRPSKGPRRTSKDIQKTLNRVVAFVEAHPGSRSEDIKKGLKLSAAQTGDALTRLVDSKTLKRKGQRRASTYTKS